MIDNFDKALKHTNARIAIFFVMLILLFSILIVKLFKLQIVMGEFLQNQVTGTTLKEITVSAPRGNILDRYGRPLAINNSSFTVNLDQSVQVENFNEMLLELYQLLEKNNEEIIDNFPISADKPYEYMFNGSESQEKRWKNNMGLDEEIAADEAFIELREKFEIDSDLTDQDARKILSLRCELYEKRYSKFIPVTIAYNIKKETIGAIEERKTDFPCVYIDVEALRNYPTGKYFSHILGYVRGITEEELETYEQYGYKLTDIVGKDGIEKSFELVMK